MHLRPVTLSFLARVLGIVKNKDCIQPEKNNVFLEAGSLNEWVKTAIKSVFLDTGWVDGSKSCFRIAYSNQKI